MTFSKKCKIIIVLIALLSGVCVLFASLAVFLHQTNQKDKPKAADLTISNRTELISFINSVNSGNTYYQKTVVLSNSINCSDGHMGGTPLKGAMNSIGGGARDLWLNSGTEYKFNGTFDGQGYSIYNYNITNSYVTANRRYEDKNKRYYYYYYYAGLFGYLGSSATVTNLKIYNYAMDISHQSDVGNYPTTHTDYKKALVGYADSGAKVNKCWVDVSSNIVHSSVTMTDMMLPSSIINGSGGSITSANNTSGLSWSSTGGSGGTTWYYSSSYNSGWPKLRIFITRACDWKDVTFSATGGIAPSSIKIPGDAYATFSSSSSSITIYDQTVTATSSSCQHATASWTANSATSYSVAFKQPNRTITINVYDASQNYTTEDYYSFGVVCCSTVKIDKYEIGSSGKYGSCRINSFAYAPWSTSYYIDSIDCSSGASITADKTITIRIKLKVYDVTFN